MVNGYVTLDLASNKIYKESLGAIKSGKPVMVVDAPNVYFADTIAISGDDVVITKGGKTITITDANSVSSVGDIEPKETKYYEIDLSDFAYNDNSLDTDYVILITNKNLDGLKYSELPIGKYPLIAHKSQSDLGNTIPLYMEKSENSLVLYNNEDGDSDITILTDKNFYLL